MGDSGLGDGERVSRNRHKAPGKKRRMCPQQRARYMAYQEPPKEVQNEVAAARQRVYARLATLKKREGAGRNAREVVGYEQDAITAQLRTAEAQIRMRLLRHRQQQAMVVGDFTLPMWSQFIQVQSNHYQQCILHL